ncbi:FAD-binding protein [Microvirga terrestris]|uniref:FAD-binding oxidoreductase n=1 Tax=Microvirga terrestris TaxID=2791024 RepID=A0ABS0HMA6_9HYPH|nr:FAD-binding oxidoreductase [Microvirga terrestris]MBF9194607.1 FAD-binding oxidoreductase [Microvirga terrestris]
MAKISRRSLLAGGGAAALSLSLPQVSRAQQRFVLNDASQLNPTPVFRHWVAEEKDDTFIARLRSELKAAQAARRPVAFGAARHSMGGQSLARDGTVITLTPSSCDPDVDKRIYRVGSGTRWRNVIAALDPIGFSPAVMQSNNDFGVASTLSVNAHGWPTPFGPFGTTVRSFRLMLADGTILTCSREENSELFALTMGGYGLFGVILDLEVEMVQNVLLKPSFQVVPTENFAQQFLRLITQNHRARMAYGRVTVARSNFLQEALIVVFHEQPRPEGKLPGAESGGKMAGLAREIYRAQTGWETGKRARWFAETVAGPSIASTMFTRNSLLNEPVSNLAGRSIKRTDILHEYFVPPERLNDFIKACREVIPRSQQELLNITLRYVEADQLSVLAYAPTARIAAVMSFSQEMLPGVEADMMRMTEELIDRVLAIGGSFYLPYRLHARRDQVEKSYPRIQRFISQKRHYDQDLLFRNLMWDAYFA